MLTQDFFSLFTSFEIVSFLPLSSFARIFPLSSLWGTYLFLGVLHFLTQLVNTNKKCCSQQSEMSQSVMLSHNLSHCATRHLTAPGYGQMSSSDSSWTPARRMPFILIPSGPLMCQHSCLCEPFLTQSRQEQQDFCKLFKHEAFAKLFHCNNSNMESSSWPGLPREPIGKEHQEM